MLNAEKGNVDGMMSLRWWGNLGKPGDGHVAVFEFAEDLDAKRGGIDTDAGRVAKADEAVGGQETRGGLGDETIGLVAQVAGFHVGVGGVDENDVEFLECG